MAYFNESEKQILADNIKNIFTQFQGFWVTPDPAMSAERRKRFSKFMKIFERDNTMIEKVAWQKYDEHGFLSEVDANKFFIKNGFHITMKNQPTVLNSLKLLWFDDEFMVNIKDDIEKHGKVWIMENN